MPKSRGRPPSRGRRRARRGPAAGREPDLLEVVGIALETGLAAPVLDYASYLLDMVDERNAPPDLPPEDEPPTLHDLIASFTTVTRHESSVLLAALAGLSGDAFLRLAVRGEVEERGHVLPGWLARLDDAVPFDRAVAITEPMDDGYQIVFGVVLPEDQHLTAVVFVDNNRGSVVTSAFVLPRRLPEVVAEMQTLADDPDLAFGELSPADARAHITEAVEAGADLYPPLMGEGWPATRPLIEWMATLLPSGGSGRVRPEWTDERLEGLVDNFFSSPFGERWRNGEIDLVVLPLLRHATTLGSGDPARISAVGAEVLLMVEAPRSVALGDIAVDDAPALLRDLIRFGHAERGLEADITSEVLETVDRFDTAYRRRVVEWQELFGRDGETPS